MYSAEPLHRSPYHLGVETGRQLPGNGDRVPRLQNSQSTKVWNHIEGADHIHSRLIKWSLWPVIKSWEAYYFTTRRSAILAAT